MSQDYELNIPNVQEKIKVVSIKKDTFNIGVLIPFWKDKYNTVTSSFKPRLYYEFLAGLKLAVQHANATSKSPFYNLFVYDSKNDKKIIDSIMALKEVQSFDLIISSLKSNAKTFYDFSSKYNIPIADPFLKTDSLMKHQDYVYFQQASFATEGKCIAKSIIKQKNEGKIYLFYDNFTYSKRTIAKACKADLDSNKNNLHFKAVGSSNATDMKNTLFNAAKNQEDIKAIVVLSNNRLVLSNLISALENGDINVPIYVNEELLNDNSKVIELDQLQRRNFHFIAPSYVYEDLPSKNLRDEFKSVLGLKPERRFAYLAYDMMYYWIHILGKYGTIPKEGIMKEPYFKGKATIGNLYGRYHSNQVVPIIKFDENFVIEPIK